MSYDPRADSPYPLEPPPPLPYVSRRALKRVVDWIPPPEACPHCGGRVSLISHEEIYGRTYSEWPYVYRCEPCDAHVGTHRDTDLPLGTLATAPMRQWRSKAKQAFFEMHARQGRPARRLSYGRLAKAMGIDPSVCHFGMFDEDQCRKAYEICQEL